MQSIFLRRIRIFLEILIQCVVYMAVITGAYLGVCKKPGNTVYLCFLMLIPVIATYILRKKTKNLTVFIVINVAFMVVAAMLGEADIDKMCYFLSVGMVCVHSIRLKTLTVKRNEYAVNYNTDYDVSGRSEDDKKIALDASEKLHPAYCVVMLAFYIVGNNVESPLLMGIQMVAFIAFILLQVVYNQVKNLENVFFSNEGKSEFPAKRIIVINAIVTTVFIMLMILGMVMFYNGRYGNIFTIIGSLFMVVVKFILKIILTLWRNDNVQDSTPIVEEESSSDMEVIEDDLLEEGYEPSAIMSALFFAIGFTLLIGTIVAIIVMIVKYAGRFKNSVEGDYDEVEFIKESPDKEKHFVKDKDRNKGEKISNNMAYRKLYKKYALSKKRNTKGKLSADKPRDCMMPEDITRTHIVEDEEVAQRITQVYEKARYSNESVTKDEIDYLKKMR